MHRRAASCLFALVFLGGCSGSSTASPTPEPPPPAAVEDADPDGALVLGDWTTYAQPDGDALEPEEVLPLDDDRWMRVSAELACAGRVERGDAGAHRAAASRVLHHHKTTAKAVMDYGIAVNVDAARAHALGARIADAVERCNAASTLSR